MTFIDLIWWTGGGILAVAGFVFAVRALFWDRSRGRKRCPKCWYDLSGGKSNRCPECGYETQQERKLYKTRRRWRRAILGVLIIFAGLTTFVGREVYRNGWVKATPTIGYIMFLSNLDRDTTHAELFRRLYEGEVRQWEYPLLVNRINGLLEKETDKEKLINGISLLHAVVRFRETGIKRKPWGSWPDLSELNLKESVNALINILDHADDELKLEILRVLGQFSENSKLVIPTLLGQAGTNDRTIRNAASMYMGALARSAEPGPYYSSLAFSLVFNPDGTTINWFGNTEIEYYATLGDAGNNSERVFQILLNGLEHESAQVRTVSIFCLVFLEADQQIIRNSIIKLKDDPTELVRREAIQATAALPFDKSVKDMILQGLLDTPDVATSAMETLSLRGTDAEEFISRLRPFLLLSPSAEQNSSLIMQASETLVEIGDNPAHLLLPLLSVIKSDSNFNKKSALWELADLGIESEEACREIRPLLDSDKAEIQSAAAYAYTMLGGDVALATRVAWTASNNGIQAKWFFLELSKMAKAGHISIPVLMEYLNSSNAAYRADAAQYLGEARRHAAEALPELRLRLTDSDPNVVFFVREAIKQIEWAIDHPESEDE